MRAIDDEGAIIELVSEPKGVKSLSLGPKNILYYVTGNNEVPAPT